VTRICVVCCSFLHNTGVIKVVSLLWDGSVARIGDDPTCLTVKTCSHNAQTAHNMLQRLWMLATSVYV